MSRSTLERDKNTYQPITGLPVAAAMSYQSIPSNPSISYSYSTQYSNISQQQAPGLSGGLVGAYNTQQQQVYDPAMLMMMMDPNFAYSGGYEAGGYNLVGETDPEDLKPSNILPIYGNTTNYNINSMLFNNVIENEYFKALFQLRTYHEVIDEFRRSVKHIEPWQTGTSRYPSSAFCLMVKFMGLRLTVKQMKGLLGLTDAPLIRGIAFIYLRYICSPTDLWKWFEPYLEDEEEIRPSADTSIKMTMGSFCIKLLTDMSYYATTFPRIPIPIERKFKVMLLLLDEKKRRRRNNARSQELGLFEAGTKVKAIYSDDKNEPAWYEAVIDSKDENNENKYWVTFPEYGNTEYIDLGDMELLSSAKTEERSKDRDRDRDRDDRRSSSRHRSRNNRSRSRSHDRGDRRRDSRDRKSRSRDRNRDKDRDRDRDNGNRSSDNLLEKVLQSERDASAAIGRNYGHRPTSLKGSLSLKVDRFTVRRKSPSPEYRPPVRRRSRSRSPNNNNRQQKTATRSLESALEQANKLKLLKEKYGDASTK